MKRLVMLVLACLLVLTVQNAQAFDGANIKIHFTGPIHDNRYFLCLPNVGCLSVLAASQGKVYPILNPVQISHLYVLNVAQNFRLYPQNISSSCQGSVEPHQTVTISGHLTVGQGGATVVKELHCTVS